MDWRKKKISFGENDRLITLKGYHIQDSSHTQALQGIVQLDEAKSAATWKMAEKQDELEPRGETLEDLQQVLETKGLQPHWTEDQGVTLRLGAKPVCVCP